LHVCFYFLIKSLISKILKKAGNFNTKPAGMMKEVQNLDYFLKECKLLGMNPTWKVKPFLHLFQGQRFAFWKRFERIRRNPI
jgi:hypothetical protein